MNIRARACSYASSRSSRLVAFDEPSPDEVSDDGFLGVVFGWSGGVSVPFSERDRRRIIFMVGAVPFVAGFCERAAFAFSINRTGGLQFMLVN